MARGLTTYLMTKDGVQNQRLQIDATAMPRLSHEINTDPKEKIKKG
jgi:hypothetical protein